MKKNEIFRLKLSPGILYKARKGKKSQRPDKFPIQEPIKNYKAMKAHEYNQKAKEKEKQNRKKPIPIKKDDLLNIDSLLENIL